MFKDAASMAANGGAEWPAAYSMLVQNTLKSDLQDIQALLCKGTTCLKAFGYEPELLATLESDLQVLAAGIRAAIECIHKQYHGIIAYIQLKEAGIQYMRSAIPSSTAQCQEEEYSELDVCRLAVFVDVVTSFRMLKYARTVFGPCCCAEPTLCRCHIFHSVVTRFYISQNIQRDMKLLADALLCVHWSGCREVERTGRKVLAAQETTALQMLPSEIVDRITDLALSTAYQAGCSADSCRQDFARCFRPC